MLLEIDRVSKIYPGRRGATSVTALDGVSFSIARGESFGLVGESGSGKSTLTRLILALEQPTAGTIRFDGVPIADLSSSALKAMRARLQIVFQDPYASLNPRMIIRDIVSEPLLVHADRKTLSAARRADRVVELLETVGLRTEHLWRYPHELSGGQRQRICIARALALEPEMLILDEPTSALDVSVQAQILNMLIELQRRLALTYLVISHDLGVIRYVCDRVALIHHGRIVEMGETERIFVSPQSDYTRMLIEANPDPDPDQGSGALSAGTGRT
jgi:ABC-type glutathione transport system ATPase component